MIKVEKLKFEKSNWPIGVEDPSRVKAEKIIQKKEAPKEANLKKAVMPMEEVSTAKIERGEAGCSSTTKGLKERLCVLNREEEKKTL